MKFTRREKLYMLKLLLPILATLFTVPQANAISPTDTEEIKLVIEAYYDGMTRGDADVLNKVFHERWHMQTLAGPAGNPLLVVVKKDYVEFNRGKNSRSTPAK
jgi:hypothetical protein